MESFCWLIKFLIFFPLKAQKSFQGVSPLFFCRCSTSSSWDKNFRRVEKHEVKKRKFCNFLLFFKLSSKIKKRKVAKKNVNSFTPPSSVFFCRVIKSWKVWHFQCGLHWWRGERWINYQNQLRKHYKAHHEISKTFESRRLCFHDCWARSCSSVDTSLHVLFILSSSEKNFR